ncbi:SDR family NAD(P)-dependent oxidoreductase [Streptomyces gibsoniae]|uniref:SDR family NAD(P)-dependent oxidoreductase n=1 Tax=Streptomyces gibsoniae TaxID=3075529 RepID=A0ABU2TX60_9ACTN|nr:SDR family NAD(P)-dependent oxidoreductase [Streptomyces sp. DSM 41699]MDT0465402.1 SDR family NAD(P)-dependent oxidoreductase [Streptomyces sp. DSM 41699]
MTWQFAGKTAFVTGGGSGIGRASALALAADGALVTVAGRTAETLKETVRLIEAAGGSARCVVADVTDEAQIEHAVQDATAGTGRLDIALNNAGYDGEYQLTKDTDHRAGQPDTQGVPWQCRLSGKAQTAGHRRSPLPICRRRLLAGERSAGWEESREAGARHTSDTVCAAGAL